MRNAECGIRNKENGERSAEAKDRSLFRIPHSAFRIQSRPGFTLVELLVVMAILSVLAGMLFPVFAQAREKARTTVCLSSQRQIGLAALMYADDYDGTLLPNANPPAVGVADQDRVWAGLIQPYLKNGGGFPARGVMVCPSWSQSKLIDAAKDPDCGLSGTSYLPGIELYAHYGIYHPMQSLAGLGTPQSPFYQYAGSGRVPTIYAGGDITLVTTSLAEVLRPAETVFISDGATFRIAAIPPPGANVATLYGCYAAAMHQGGGNFIFLDGHSKWIAGNIRRYVKQNAAGQYFRRYETYSME